MSKEVFIVDETLKDLKPFEISCDLWNLKAYIQAYFPLVWEYAHNEFKHSGKALMSAEWPPSEYTRLDPKFASHIGKGLYPNDEEPTESSNYWTCSQQVNAIAEGFRNSGIELKFNLLMNYSQVRNGRRVGWSSFLYKGEPKPTLDTILKKTAIPIDF